MGVTSNTNEVNNFNEMKIKFLLATAVILCGAAVANAQNPLKIGHVNIQELVQKHPMLDSLQTVIEKESKDMQEIYDEMVAEHEAAIEKFEVILRTVLRNFM